MKNEKPVLRKHKLGQKPEVNVMPVPEKQTQTFRDYIKHKRKRYPFDLPASYLDSLKENDKERDRDWLTVKAVAFFLGMKCETCRKLIGQDPSKGKEHRDFVIALSMILDMSVDETNKALELFYNTPKLHEDTPRDACLIDIINNIRLRAGRDNEDNPYDNSSEKSRERPDPVPLDEKVEYANQILQAKLYDELDIIRPRIQKKTSPTGSKEKPERKTEIKPAVNSPAVPEHAPVISPYKKISSVYTMNEVYPDIYSDLESAYSLWRYSTVTKMVVSDESGEKKYTLSADSHGGLHSKPHQTDDPADTFLRTTNYSSSEDAGDFAPFFLELRSSVQRGWEQLLLHLNDTRNYNERLGGGMSGDSIHIFAEQYNYNFPERFQFLLTEYVNGEYRFSVFHRSMFMALNLTKEEYSRHYRNEIPSPVFVFRTEEDFKKARCEEYLPVYNRMKKKIGRTLDLLRSKKVFVRNLGIIWAENPERVCSWFNVEKQFKCINHYFRLPNIEETYMREETDENEYEPLIESGSVMRLQNKEVPDIKNTFLEVSESEAMTGGYDECFLTPAVQEAGFRTDDGTTVTITVADLMRAFELGFSDIDQICRVKHLKGSVEAVLR